MLKNLTTVTFPNLICTDLVITHPMTSMAGYINYLKFVKGSNKGESHIGDVVNSAFKLGNVDVDYTGDKVVEATESDGGLDFAWGPAVADTVYAKLAGSWTKVGEALLKKDANGKIIGLNDASFAAGTKVRYIYDNVVIPQNDVPILNAVMDSIGLVAHARRIAVYYSQLAEFQAKQDYGFDLGDSLAEQAVAELRYELDTEVTQLLIDNAVQPATGVTRWNKALPTGVAKAEHYAGFAEVVTQAAVEVYNRTKKHMPNYIIISPTILPILDFVPGFTAAAVAEVNGPYFAGTLKNLKVFVTPNIEDNKFVVGVNGSDMRASAAVYAPYMPIVPTQLMQYNDGGTTQGWSTLYDLKLLNADLLIKGEVYTDLTEVVSNTVRTTTAE